ncbi:MAG: tRNA preQ1(34) S-adenosylmethionine ribosyltransferase-isomerase QueA [Terriglobus sp.]
MRVSDFDFHLPPDRIAQHPPAERGDSRMLLVDRHTGQYKDAHFRDFPAQLRKGDLLILNNSRVIPARLFARRAGLNTQHNSPAPTGQVEVLLTQPLGNDQWRALVKPGRKVPIGERLLFEAPHNRVPQVREANLGIRAEARTILLEADVIASGDFGERTIQFKPTQDFFGTLEQLGHMPLPPYIHRTEDDEEEDRTRYQTVYAGQNTHGSAAAPTAGLHFTPAVLEAIRSKGVQVEYITLHVGLGTFQPVRVEDLADIRLHEEPYTIPATTATAIHQAKAEGRRIIAVGTTTTRTLEHIAATNRIEPHSGTTSIFLQPGHRFQLVNALLTNFHLPKSTLMMLVSALTETEGQTHTGREKILAAYAHAVQANNRFFSYGDCMFLS